MSVDATPEADPVVQVTNLSKRFRRADGIVVRAIDDVSFEVQPGQMVVLVGPSGCGKTTLLRSIAGLEQPDSGEIAIHGRTCYSSNDRVVVPPEQRRVSMVFQNYALWPHLTAFQNVVYPLRSSRERRVAKADAAERVHSILALVGIPDLARQYPHEMSGGQRQRVALARALVAGTDLVLFDEPLSNVDAKVRTQLRLELLAMQRELGFSALFVTHDQAEAMELAHRIAVMGSGRIEQFGSPKEIYDAPRSRYVADFIGTANELTGTVVAVDAHSVHVTTDMGDVTGRPGSSGLRVGEPVSVVWRPERTRLVDAGEVADSDCGGNTWNGSIVAALFLGAHTEHVVDVDGHRFVVWSPDAHPRSDGAPVRVSVDPSHVWVLPGQPEIDG